MIRQSFGLVLGIVLSLGAMELPSFARPNGVHFNPNAGVHRTIIGPSRRTRNSYYPRNSYDRGGGYSRSRERIIIEREQRGYCHSCGYSHDYNPYRNYRGYGRAYRSVPRRIDYDYYR